MCRVSCQSSQINYKCPLFQGVGKAGLLFMSQEQTIEEQKQKNKKQKRTAHRAGPSIGGWNFSGLWCHDGSHNPGLQLQLRGRMETRTPGLSLHSTVNVKLIKSFPKNGCTEPKFPISISEKWESCLRSQTLRADIAHFLCKKPPASSGSVEASA